MTNTASYTATALGDLDCDATHSSCTLHGPVDEKGEVVTRGPMVTSEIE